MALIWARTDWLGFITWPKRSENDGQEYHVGNTRLAAAAGGGDKFCKDATITVTDTWPALLGLSGHAQALVEQGLLPPLPDHLLLHQPPLQLPARLVHAHHCGGSEASWGLLLLLVHPGAHHQDQLQVPLALGLVGSRVPDGEKVVSGARAKLQPT